MKITFLKDHLENKKGSDLDVSDERGNYFISVGVAKKSEVKKVKVK